MAAVIAATVAAAAACVATDVVDGTRDAAHGPGVNAGARLAWRAVRPALRAAV